MKKLIYQLTINLSRRDADLVVWFALNKGVASKLIKAAIVATIEERDFALPEIPYSMLENNMKHRFVLHFYSGEDRLINYLKKFDSGCRSAEVKKIIYRSLRKSIPVEYQRMAFSKDDAWVGINKRQHNQHITIVEPDSRKQYSHNPIPTQMKVLPNQPVIVESPRQRTLLSKLIMLIKK